jgi:hypothetical protein
MIDPVKECYYCCASTDPDKRVTELRLALWTLPLVLIGIVLLVLAGRSETPVTAIADFTMAHKSGQQRVIGEVVRVKPFRTPYPASDVLSVFVADDSVDPKKGSLKVKVVGEQIDELRKAGRYPRKGDKIDVEGTFYIGPGFKTLNLNSSGMLRIVERGGK